MIDLVSELVRCERENTLFEESNFSKKLFDLIRILKINLMINPAGISTHVFFFYEKLAWFFCKFFMYDGTTLKDVILVDRNQKMDYAE